MRILMVILSILAFCVFSVIISIFLCALYIVVTEYFDKDFILIPFKKRKTKILNGLIHEYEESDEKFPYHAILAIMNPVQLWFDSGIRSEGYGCIENTVTYTIPQKCIRTWCNNYDIPVSEYHEHCIEIIDDYYHISEKAKKGK